MKSRILYRALLICVLFSACGHSPADKTPLGQTTVTDTSMKVLRADTSKLSALEYLLNSSAKDFHDHQLPLPLKFKGVELKVLPGNSSSNYMICGEFLTINKDNQEVWTAFATIKTSDYEQWLGAQSIGYCNEAKLELVSKIGF